ncbi:MAG: helix-turn-helix domain-containing protein [Planctomycetes bacterium]|nr:helix-turn-helix domain-containing protein [Planctomycetota bacterium]
METRDALGALAALAHATRLAVFRALVRAGPAGVPAGALSQRLAVPPATLSFHLAALARAGLVASRREGRSIRYAADFRAMRALVDFLTEDCCAGLRPEGRRRAAPARAASRPRKEP